MSRIGSHVPGDGEKQTARASLARIALVAALAIAAALALCTNALALGAPVNVGTPFDINALSVATDASGTAYIAWANDRDLPPTSTDVVQYCVLPVDATGCSYSNTLTPADGAVAIDNVQVLVDGAKVVVLADVFGAKGSEAGDYTPEQEWQSTDGGATFALVNGGKSVASGILDADTEPLSAVILPGTNVLGYGWNTAGSSSPTFSAFPLTAPPECSAKSCAAGFAELEPNTNPDQIGNAGGAFASQSGPSAGVLGIFNTNFTNGPLGCAESFGTAYTYGSGEQSPTNNYNISPGQPNSAWKVPVSQADCNAEYPAVAGGPSGFGVIEDNLGTGDAVYHRFDQTTEKFDTPQVTIAPEFEEQPSVSQDAAGGVYATYLAGFGGQVHIAYSYDGGTTWSGPATLNADEDGGAGDLTSTVDATGQGWAAWIDNGSVYAQSFDAEDTVVSAPTTLTTSQTAGGASGANIAVSAGTVGESDHATIVGANAGGATGTMDYGLYSASGCPAASRVFTSVVAVTSGAAAPSAAVTSALAPGTYYWSAAYSGNAGTVLGAKGNEASASACGSEVLTVLPATVVPSGAYTVKSIVANSDGTVTITLIPTQSGAASLVVTVPTASIASVAAVDAKAKKCKHGQIKIKGKCRPASTAVGKTSGKGTAGVPLKLVVHLSGKIKAQLAKGKTVHLTATLTYTSALGGKATVHTYQLTVKGHKRGKGKK
ncbi:MAG TPA: hypothetical protein VGL57_10400 [Solirubrobacteraceae bacterium]|jgi:hypothetical protein